MWLFAETVTILIEKKFTCNQIRVSTAVFEGQLTLYIGSNATSMYYGIYDIAHFLRILLGIGG